MKYRRLGRTGLRVGGWDRDLAAQRRVGTALYPARGGSAAGTSTSTGPWREPPRHRRVLWGPPDRSAHRRRQRGEEVGRDAGAGPGEQVPTGEPGPVAARDRTAPTAGTWRPPGPPTAASSPPSSAPTCRRRRPGQGPSCRSCPASSRPDPSWQARPPLPGAAAPPPAGSGAAATGWRWSCRPGEGRRVAVLPAVVDRGGLDPQHLADQRGEHGHRTAELPGEDRPELVGLLLGGDGVHEQPDPPVAVGHERHREVADVHVVDVPESTWKASTARHRS